MCLSRPPKKAKQSTINEWAGGEQHTIDEWVGEEYKFTYIEPVDAPMIAR